jgi:hypothetical protein
MLKNLLHPVAVDINGNSVHISNAKKGGEYYCPYCKNKFVFNRSVKTGKGSRRPHFSHDKLSKNCTPEGYLHSTFKLKLVERLNQCIVEHLTLEMQFKCNYCLCEHAFSLSKDLFAVKEEYNLKICRPDIALFNENRDVYAVIEIVVTHEPEDVAIKFYKENKIVLIQINLDSEEDLEKVDEKIKFPSKVITFDPSSCSVYCHQPRQKVVSQRQSIRTLGYRGGPRIEQIESLKMANERKRYFAIQKYYRKKSKMKK